MTTRNKPTLNGVSPDSNSPIELAAWEAFCKMMRDYRYGENETRDAWAWFYKGWHGHIVGPRHLFRE